MEIASPDIDPDLSRRMGMQQLRRPAAPAPAVAPVRTALFPAMAFEPRDSDRGLRSLAGRVDVEGLSLNYLTDFYGSAVTVREDPWDGYCISTVLRGRIHLQPTPPAEPIAGGGPVGLILRGRPGYRMLTGDRSARLNLWFQTKAVARRLEALTDGVARGELEFHPTIDWQSAQGASIARLVEMAKVELGRPGSLLSHATGRAAFEEMLALALLHGLQHSHSALLAAPAAAPAPRHLHRAESFLRANLDRIITLEAVAAAAGCSIRTLQQAFRQWRDTTPMAAWRDLRLDAAHAALSRREPARSVEAVAQQFCFFNRNRFAQGYRCRHGEYPTQTRGAGNAEP